MKLFELKIGRIELVESNQSEKQKILHQFPDLFSNTRTIRDTETNTETEKVHYLAKQRGRQIPLHLQAPRALELKNSIKAGHLEKVINVDDDCLVSLVGSDNSEEQQVR